MNYLLDSNTYIQAKNTYYDMAFCPAYWDWLDLQFQLGQLASIASVYDELTSGDDKLSIWVKERKDQFLPISDEATQQNYTEIVNYVDGLEPTKSRQQIDSFLDKADPWLIAKAIVTNATVVTHEALDPPTSKKVKIPNVCKHFDVTYINTYQLLNTLNARFILDP